MHPHGDECFPPLHYLDAQMLSEDLSIPRTSFRRRHRWFEPTGSPHSLPSRNVSDGNPTSGSSSRTIETSHIDCEDEFGSGVYDSDLLDESRDRGVSEIGEVLLSTFDSVSQVGRSLTVYRGRTREPLFGLCRFVWSREGEGVSLKSEITRGKRRLSIHS